MAIVRTYSCEACGTTFDKLHFDRNEPAPECPGCAALAAHQVPAGFSIGGSNVSKAADITYGVMESYGFTDMKSSLREGDTAAPNLPTRLEPMVKSFFAPPGEIIAAAKSGAQAARAEGSNPLTLVQSRAKAGGTARPICNPVNRVR